MIEPRRQFHIGDLLAVVLDAPDVAPRGIYGVRALLAYMAGVAVSISDYVEYAEDFRSAILDVHPGLATFCRDAAPSREMAPEFVRRRVAEFGAYLTAPLLPADHPLHRSDRTTPLGERAASDERDNENLPHRPGRERDAPSAALLPGAATWPQSRIAQVLTVLAYFEAGSRQRAEYAEDAANLPREDLEFCLAALYANLQFEQRNGDLMMSIRPSQRGGRSTTRD